MNFKKLALISTVTLAFAACERHASHSLSEKTIEAKPIDRQSEQIQASVVRINSTSQSWNPGRPWEKKQPKNINALGAIIEGNLVLTSAEVVADATYIELQTTDATKTVEAKVVAHDYEVNLALLTVLDPEEEKLFFEATTPLALADAPKIGDTLQFVQIENNNTTLLTEGHLQAVEVVNSFLTDHYFLNYMVKASLQSAASSFSLPVIRDNKLQGILLGYDSGDQLSDILSIEVISRFIKDAQDGDYRGIPTLGLATSNTEDPLFRDFLKLQNQDGGLYINHIDEKGAAAQAGLKKGDVILAANGFAIDSRGYYQHATYGTLYWSHLIEGEKSIGDKIELSLLRKGEPLTIKATLQRSNPKEQLVPTYRFDKAPNFLTKGGMIFQELTLPLLRAYGKDWYSRAPLNLMAAMEDPQKYEAGRKRVVFLSGTIPTPATVGYERLRNLIVESVNGVKIKDMASLISAFETPNKNGLHAIKFIKEDFTIYLDERVATSVDGMLLQRGLPRLSRVN